MPFHVRITTKKTKTDNARHLVRGDLTAQELEERFLAPYRRGDSITLRGTTVLAELLEKIEIRESAEPLAALRAAYEEASRGSGFINLSLDSDYLAAGRAADRTDDFIRGAPGHERLAATAVRSEPIEAEKSASSRVDQRTVFVVHGRDQQNNEAMYDLLRALGLGPKEFDSLLAGSGEGAPYVGNVVLQAIDEAGATVVVLTPDEEAVLVAGLRTTSDDGIPRLQPRPNVLFEAGIAMASPRPRTIFVEIGKTAQFSDVVGRHTLRFDGSLEARLKLAERLRGLGCPIDTSGERWKRAGTFRV
jgi:predicted nucleotide-binding protein